MPFGNHGPDKPTQPPFFAGMALPVRRGSSRTAILSLAVSALVGTAPVGAQALPADANVAALPASSPATPQVPVPVSALPLALPAPRTADAYLLGSGEAAALSRTTWAALVDYVTRALATPQRQGVVLAEGSTLAAPRFVPCDGKPAAVVMDVDESALLNVGWQYDDAGGNGRPFALARWRRWEATGARKVAPTPGAVEAVSRLRALGVQIVFNSNRDADLAGATVQAIAAAGLGDAEPGRTLYLREPAGASGKDARRAAIAADRCVVAMLGDQLGDFSDLFDAGRSVAARRAVTASPAIADMWGEGWFVMPNPLYGTALKGDANDLYPAELRWTDPGPAQPPAPAATAASPPIPAPTSAPVTTPEGSAPR